MSADVYFSSQASTQELRSTQDFCSQSLIEEDSNIWGHLFPITKKFQTYNLKNDCHSFGRGTEMADHCFTEEHFEHKVLSVISKIHFKITRKIEANDHIIIIEDSSSNGTFVNGALIGKNKKVVLQNNDEISVAQPKRKVFVFYDCMKNDSNEFPPKLTQNYTMSRKIGDGSFGQVRLAYRQGSIERVAIKIMKKSNFNSNGAKMCFNTSSIDNEINLLYLVNHPCITKLLDLIESKDKIYIVMELAEGGELFDRISSNVKLKEPIAKLYFFQLLLAVAYLHGKKITHRDIKPENILLDSEKDHTLVKLTDFGLSKLAEDVSQMTTFCGTQTYIAPELLNPTKKGYTNKVDMWSIGVVLYVSLVGHLPFYAKDDITQRLSILNGKYSFNHPNWLSVSENAKDLVRKLLIVDDNARLSAKEALDHIWFQDEEMRGIVRDLLGEKGFDDHIDSSPLKRSLDVEEDKVDGESASKMPKIMSGLEFGHE